MNALRKCCIFLAPFYQHQKPLLTVAFNDFSYLCNGKLSSAFVVLYFQFPKGAIFMPKNSLLTVIKSSIVCSKRKKDLYFITVDETSTQFNFVPLHFRDMQKVLLSGMYTFYLLLHNKLPSKLIDFF